MTEAQNVSSLRFTDSTGTYTVEVPDVGLRVHDLLDDLIVPVLLAAGYPRTSIIESMVWYARLEAPNVTD